MVREFCGFFYIFNQAVHSWSSKDQQHSGTYKVECCQQAKGDDTCTLLW